MVINTRKRKYFQIEENPENSERIWRSFSKGNATSRLYHRNSDCDVQIPKKVHRLELRDQFIRVGHLFPNYSSAVPQVVATSKVRIFQEAGFVSVKRATRRPKGKGFSIGCFGEVLIVVHKSNHTNCEAKSNGHSKSTSISQIDGQDDSDSDSHNSNNDGQVDIGEF